MPYFVSFSLFGFTSVMKLRNFDFENHWNILIFFNKKDMTSDLNSLNMSHGKTSDFVSFPLFGFTLVMKLRNFDFESHWNTLIFFNEEDMTSDLNNLNMSHGKMSDFVLFPLFGSTLVIKLRNFNFEIHGNTLILFYKKMIQIWMYPITQCLIWFELCCLSRISTICWEIRILNVIEII